MRISHGLVFGAIFVFGCTGNPLRRGTGATGSTTEGGTTAGGTTAGGTTAGGTTAGGTTAGGTTGTTTNGNLDGGVPDGSACGSQTFTLMKGSNPDIVIVLDHSGSMEEELDGTDNSGGPTNGGVDPMDKWNLAVQALNSVVMSTQGQALWGLEVFPSDDNCGTSSTLAVNVEKNAASDVSTALAGINDPYIDGGSTPTPEAINSAVTALQAINDGNPKYILLATDGEPSCDASDDTVKGTVAASVAATKAGIGMFVLGLSQVKSDITALESIAAGVVYTTKTQPTTPPPNYFPVANQAQLSTSLESITGSIISCTLQLNSAPPNPSYVSVTEGGKGVPQDTTHTNGWDFGAGDTTIQLYGTYCTNLQNATITDVSATFGCSVPPPPT